MVFFCLPASASERACWSYCYRTTHTRDNRRFGLFLSSDQQGLGLPKKMGRLSGVSPAECITRDWTTSLQVDSRQSPAVVASSCSRRERERERETVLTHRSRPGAPSAQPFGCSQADARFTRDCHPRLPPEVDDAMQTTWQSSLTQSGRLDSIVADERSGIEHSPLPPYTEHIVNLITISVHISPIHSSRCWE